VRTHDAQGTAVAEMVTTEPPDPSSEGRILLRQLVHGGEIVDAEPLTAARARHREALAELPQYALQLSRGYPAIPTIFSPNGD
jgi:nicotinate phosphoribosyltransferase